MAAYAGGGTLEWNSNLAVLIRCDKIINAINDSRFRTTQFDDYGNPRAEVEEVLSHIITLYKEISVELTDGEKKVWEDLKTLRDKLRNNPPKKKPERMQYWQNSMNQIDELDLKIRALAKKRGFLAGNKRDVSKAGLRR
jgi:predicted NodU family carbamoyl transferase